MAIITVVAGFLVVGQMRAGERFSQPLEAESEEDLTRILASLNAEADALRDEIGTLRLRLVELRSTSARDAAATRAAADQLAALEVLAGTTKVEGPGVVVEMRDSNRAVRYEVLIDIVQELRDAGAEAIAINNHRVGVTSWFSERGGIIILDGAELREPFSVAAIGEPATLDGGLEIPGGAVDAASALRGVTVGVRRLTRVELPALTSPPTLDVARPVGSES
ncbi:MAG TPA: DUF881 domain-containing protein [Acidimicrobiales bacterium]|nr:DUF881 domain-containing protein [Acidimicrobiales bacterium]